MSKITSYQSCIKWVHPNVEIRNVEQDYTPFPDVHRSGSRQMRCPGGFAAPLSCSCKWELPANSWRCLWQSSAFSLSSSLWPEAGAGAICCSYANWAFLCARNVTSSFQWPDLLLMLEQLCKGDWMCQQVHSTKSCLHYVSFRCMSS